MYSGATAWGELARAVDLNPALESAGRVGCEALRANVQHRMDWSAFITGDAAAAAARRDRAMSTHFQGGDPGSVGQAHAMSRLNHGPRGDGAW